MHSESHCVIKFGVQWKMHVEPREFKQWAASLTYDTDFLIRFLCEKNAREIAKERQYLLIACGDVSLEAKVSSPKVKQERNCQPVNMSFLKVLWKFMLFNGHTQCVRSLSESQLLNCASSNNSLLRMGLAFSAGSQSNRGPASDSQHIRWTTFLLGLTANENCGTSEGDRSWGQLGSANQTSLNPC